MNYPFHIGLRRYLLPFMCSCSIKDILKLELVLFKIFWRFGSRNFVVATGDRALFLYAETYDTLSNTHGLVSLYACALYSIFQPIYLLCIWYTRIVVDFHNQLWLNEEIRFAFGNWLFVDVCMAESICSCFAFEHLSTQPLFYPV